MAVGLGPNGRNKKANRNSAESTPFTYRKVRQAGITAVYTRTERYKAKRGRHQGKEILPGKPPLANAFELQFAGPQAKRKP